MNETSSRSHAVLIVKIITKDENNSSLPNPDGSESSTKLPSQSGIKTGDVSYRESTLMLVDLAGSERANATTGKSSLRAEEAKAINLSLSALGNCMSALAAASTNSSSAEGGKTHVPYRDSKLTRLLQGCLGGGARTAVVVTLAPGTDTAGESLSALRFASRASKVKVSAQVTRYKDYESLYRDMKKQLKDFQINGAGNISGGVAAADSLQSKLRDQEETLLGKDRQLDQQAMEISMLKQQLLALQGQSSLVHRAGAGGSSTAATNEGTVNTVYPTTTAASSSSTDANLSSAEWAEKLELLTQSHLTAIAAAHRTYAAKLSQAQQKEQTALHDLHAVQLDLKAERERSLQSMRSVRETQDARNNDENTFKSRISELLAELSVLRDNNENLESSVETLQRELNITRERLQIADAQLANSVSKEQVKEMEGLFIETVTKLSERVNMLEGKKGKEPTSERAGSAGGYSNMKSNGGGSNTNTSASNYSGNSSRDVRIEPGGRIRAGSSKDPTYANSNSALNTLAGMQHSQSTGTVTPGSTSGLSGANNSHVSGAGGGGGSGGGGEPTKGKLW